jgi:hypothetical protein
MPMGEAYPSASEIQGGQQEAAAAMGGQPNPVMDALKTLQMYVSAQAQQGKQELVPAFMQFLEVLAPGQGQQMQPPMEEQGAMDAMAAQPRPQSMGMRETQNKPAQVMSA